MSCAFVSAAPLPLASSVHPTNASRRPRTAVAMCQGEGRTRRSFMRDICSVALLAFARVPESLAAVAFDTDRFGDKELKVSAINKVKQNVRNTISQRPELLPAFFMLGVKDALTYNADSNQGGPNASITYELDQPYADDVREAADALKAVRTLQREDMSYADTIAFAGAVAVEVSGGPRLKIQLGREDASQGLGGGTYTLYKKGAGADDLATAFSSAGLDPASSVVLVHGAMGILNDIAQARALELAKIAEDPDEEDLQDVTYGKVTSGKRGAVLVSSDVSQLTLGAGKFSNKYLQALLKQNKQDPSKLSERDKVIVANPAMLAQVEKYASNNSKFIADSASLYERMSLLGSSYENLKFED